MSAAWVIERRRLYALATAILIIGLLSDRWLIAFVLPTFIYIAWQLLQLYRLERWLSRGYKPRQVPDSSGAWESLIGAILRIRKKDKLLQKRLTKAAKGYRNTVKALPDAAIVLNQKLEIEWANQLAEQYLGIISSRDLGYRISNLIRSPEFAGYLTNPSPKGHEMESPNDPDMILSIRAIRYGQNQQLILGRDISERVRARNSLQAFISNASHELRTPLTVTSGYIDILLDDPEIPQHLQEATVQLRRQTDHMTRLINDLLTLSRIEGDTLVQYEGHVVNVPLLLNEFTKNLRQTGADREHPITLQIDPLLAIRGVEKEIVSVYTNLIENAIKYTPPGTPIIITWQENFEGSACLIIRDEGPGFEQKYAPRLTQRFYRIESNEAEGKDGTGLGLAIVKHAVNHHGGTLEIESKPGEGATFIACFLAARSVKLRKNPI